MIVCPPQMDRTSLLAAATASDLRLDRRFAFRFDARAPKWDLKRPRTWTRSRFAFFMFFGSGGESACFLRKEANSPPPKLAFSFEIKLKRQRRCKFFRALTPLQPDAFWRGTVRWSAVAFRFSSFLFLFDTPVRKSGHSGREGRLAKWPVAAVACMVRKLSLCWCSQRSLFFFATPPERY